MEKIIYISYTPLTLKVEKVFWIDDVIQNGIAVEYWNISNIFFENLRISDEIERNYVKKIDNIKEFKKFLVQENIKNVIFIMLITYGWDVLWLHKILTQYKCTIFFLCRGMLPPLKNKKISEKIFDCLKNHDFGKIYRFITNRNRIALICRNIKLVKHYDVVFAAGNRAINLYRNVSNIVLVNHFDYDDYLVTKHKSQRLINERYCVFLDEYLPYHPDFKMFNIETVDPYIYYKKINRFFGMIEENFKLKVVIAVHPKSDYDNSAFCNRFFYKYRTNELVKDCEFAIAHSSTSISFPVLYKKPIVFIYDNEIKKIHAQNCFRAIEHYANVLGCSLYNIDLIQATDEISINKVDFKKYNKYKYDYLTSAMSENKFSKDIFLDYILQAND